MRLRERLARIPIRLKLTLAFACVMTAALGLIALFVYFDFQVGLDDGIDRSLEVRADDLAPVATRDSGRLPPDPDAARGGSFAQVLDSRGRVIGGTPLAADRAALLSVSEIARALRGVIIVQRREHRRMRAQPLRGARVLVVGISLAQRERSLETLAGALLIGGPLVLLVACASGYALTGSALRPVELMRRRAATISVADASARLPLPDAHDELRRLAQTLNAMLARLEAAFEHERSFVADASHELRTPLAVLKGELELALTGARSQSDLVDALESADEEADRLVRLAEDLLALAEADQHRLVIRPQPTDVDDLAREVVGRFAARAAGRPIDVETPGPVVVAVDPGRVEQAIVNLVENALRHGRGPVTVAVLASNGRAEVHVRDRGEGFADGLLGAAFDRFARGDPARGRGGTGLGLAIVRAIARAHGGDAGAANRPGGGADVWISLPSARTGAGRAGPTASGPRAG